MPVVVSKSVEVSHRIASTSETEPLAETKVKPRVELPGLTWVSVYCRVVSDFEQFCHLYSLLVTI